MKRPRPSPPADMPAGTVTLNVPIPWFSVALHVTSVSLDPNDVSRWFGVEPTESYTKGVPILRPDGTVQRVPKFGRWEIKVKPSATDEWDLNEVIADLLRPLPQDNGIWERVAQLGTLELSVGLELTERNQEFALEHDLLKLLGERRIRCWVDVYRKDGEESSDDVPAA